MTEILDERPLSAEEYALTRWLLEHGTSAAARHLDELPRARVVSRCGCGCASIDFGIDGLRPAPGTPMEVLADYQWRDASGLLAGVFVFAREGMLAGLEVWSIDGDAAVDRLPTSDVLEPISDEPAGVRRYPTTSNRPP